MFMMHISLALGFIVLLASTVLIIWSKRNKGAGSRLGKFVGTVVFILSLLSILCTGYSGYKFWGPGPMGMHMGMGHMGMGMGMGMNKEMMDKMPQMMEKMMGNMDKKAEMGPGTEEDHDSHQSQ